jgi:pimeloyl-ACP methyl ester carboxylesterase
MIRAAPVTHVRTVDGVELAIRVHVPETEPVDAAVVVAHGFSATKDDARVDAVARALSGRGYTAVTYDARGHGASTGETTLGVLEQHDVAAAVDVARSYGSRVVVVGTSMGAIAALHHAAEQHHELAGVVTVSSPARWRLPRNVRGVLAALLVQTRAGRSIARSRLGVRIAARVERGPEPAEVARTIGCPVAVIHGTADPFIATSEAELIHHNLRGPAQLVMVEGLAHAFEPSDRVTPAILDAVEWVLSP